MRRVLSFILLLAVQHVNPSFAVEVDLTRRVSFDIPAQSLPNALLQFSTQSGVEFTVATGAVEGLKSKAVRGTYETAAALALLLEDTGLKYEPVAGGTVAIRGNDDVKQGALANGAQAQLKLARADTPPPSATSADDARQTNIQEVVVTAQKRSERLQDVPISISVIDGAQLDKSTLVGVAEELNRVPGVSAQMVSQGGGTQLAIRGVTAAGGLFSGATPIGYYFDMVPFGFIKSAVVPDSSPYDLERVEALRGPQGTLYGASAQNGVIRVLTRDANLDRFEFKARTLASQVQDGGAGYGGNAAINVPIVDGKFAARAVAGYQKLAGWIDRAGDKDANDTEIQDFRLKLNARPIENLSIGTLLWLSRTDQGAPPIGNTSLSTSATFDESTSTDYDVFGLKIAYDFPGATLSSASSYLGYENNGYLDYQKLVAANRLQTTLWAHAFSQEVLLQSSRDGAWRWSIGGIYRDVQTRFFQWRRGYVNYGYIRDTSASKAVFGELTRAFMDGRLELTGGLRYYEEELRGYELARSGLAAGLPLTAPTRSTADATSPRVVLNWHPNAQSTLYASYGEGFRGGYPQAAAVFIAAPQFPSTQPDTLKNYEIGAKGTLWNGRLSFDAAVFYIDWQDVQQTVTTNVGTVASPINVSVMVNGDSASGSGFEFALNSQPTDRLTLGLNFSWNDLKLDAAVVSGNLTLFDKGSRLNYSPESTAGASAGYEFPMGGSGYRGNFSVAANYISEQEVHVVFGAVRIAKGDNLLIGRSSFAVESPNGWTASLFVDNINNEDGTAIASGFVDDWSVQLRPRTYGMQLDYAF